MLSHEQILLSSEDAYSVGGGIRVSVGVPNKESQSKSPKISHYLWEIHPFLTACAGRRGQSAGCRSVSKNYLSLTE